MSAEKEAFVLLLKIRQIEDKKWYVHYSSGPQRYILESRDGGGVGGLTHRRCLDLAATTAKPVLPQMFTQDIIKSALFRFCHTENHTARRKCTEDPH